MLVKLIKQYGIGKEKEKPIKQKKGPKNSTGFWRKLNIWQKEQ